MPEQYISREDLERQQQRWRAEYEAQQRAKASPRFPVSRATGQPAGPQRQSVMPQAGNQVRRPAPQPVAAPKVAQEETPVTPNIRHGHYRAIGAVVIGALTVGGLFASGKLSMDDIKHVLGPSQQKSAEAAINPATDGQISHVKAAGPEGFNLDNCKQPDAAVDTLVVNGRMPLIYQLQSSAKEGAAGVIKPEPYLTSADTASTKLAPFATKSGFPEMTFNDLVVKVYACAKEGATVTTDEGNGLKVNLSELDISLVPVNPNVAVQTDQAYIDTTKANGVNVTWPADPYIPKDASIYTDASVDAIDAAHGSDQQLKGAFNIGFKTLVQEAADAQADGAFNQTAIFDDGDSKVLYDAIKLGIAERASSRDYSVDQIHLDGSIGSLVPQIGSDQPQLLYLDADPEKRFLIDQTQVMIGDYTPAGSQPTATPSPTETN